MRPTRGVDEIGCYQAPVCPRGPSKIGPVSGEYTPQKLFENTWDFLLKSYYSWQNNKISKTNELTLAF